MSGLQPVVCGLDLSLTATGVAVDGFPFTIRTKNRGLERLLQIVNEVTAVIDRCNVDVFAIEGFSYGSKGNAVFEIGGLGWIVRLSLYERDVPYVVVPPSVLKKYATGKGNANKTEVIKAAWSRLGYEGTDDNQADALWLRALVSDALGFPLVEVPRAHRSALDKLDVSGVAFPVSREDTC